MVREPQPCRYVIALWHPLLCAHWRDGTEGNYFVLVNEVRKVMKARGAKWIGTPLPDWAMDEGRDDGEGADGEAADEAAGVVGNPKTLTTLPHGAGRGLGGRAGADAAAEAEAAADERVQGEARGLREIAEAEALARAAVAARRAPPRVAADGGGGDGAERHDEL